jgi:DNA-binding MarR family transcriptional regulator
MEKRADEALRTQLDIGFAQYKVLEVINHNPLAKQNVVADLLDQTEASISRQIRILQAKGLIKANEVMGNKRARELTLTIQGEELVSQAKEILDITAAHITGTIGYPEQRILQEQFDRMIDLARQVHFNAYEQP